MNKKFFLIASSPPSGSVTSASACLGTAAPPGPQTERRARLAKRQRSWHSRSSLVLHPDRAGCWRWKHLRQAPKAPLTRPAGSCPRVGTGSAPGTCSGDGRWRCCPACPQWWWGREECTEQKCCGCHLENNLKKENEWRIDHFHTGI